MNIPSRLILAATLALGGCDHEPSAPTPTAVDVVKNEMREAQVARAERVAQEAPEKAKTEEPAAFEAEDQTQLEALKVNAPTYEAGFVEAANAYRNALNQGGMALSRFVAQKTAEFKKVVAAKGLKGEGPEKEENRFAELMNFTGSIPAPKFTYGSAIIYYSKSNEKLWQEYLWKSIAVSKELHDDANFGTGFMPEGEGDARPELSETVTVKKGENTYVFESNQNYTEVSGADNLSIAFGVKGKDPQEMEFLSGSWSEFSSENINGKIVDYPSTYSNAYYCNYDPTKNSETHENLKRAVVPDRLKKLQR